VEKMKNITKQMLRDFQTQINEFIYDFSDCSICGLCCKGQVLTIHVNDANRISRKLGIERKSFYDQYTNYSQKTHETVMNMPCPFLEDNRCKIYTIRPGMCRNFPISFMENGVVIIHNIEECAKATHFFELFLDFCSKKHPDQYENLIKERGNNSQNEDSIVRAVLSLEHVILFFIWLNSDQEE